MEGNPPRIKIMTHKFNIAAYAARRRSSVGKMDHMVLPSPKEDPEVTPEDLFLNRLTPKHYKLYQRIYADSNKPHHSKSQSKHQPATQFRDIDEIISKHLKQKNNAEHFRHIYSVPVPEQPNYRKHPVLMETQAEKDNTQLGKLSSNPEELADIYENSLLQYYYYRNLELEASDVKYLKKDFNTARHKKLTMGRRQTEKIYASHNQELLTKEKMTSFLKNDKDVQQAVKLARRNVTFKRSLNQDRIKYLIGCMNLSKTEPTAESEYKSILKKLFFRFSNREGNEKSRYYEITFDKYLDLIRKLAIGDTEAEAEQIFYETISYKSQKILCFQDFVAVMRKIAKTVLKDNTDSKSDPLERFVQSYITPKKSLYLQQIHLLFNVYHSQILSFMKKSRYNFCIENLFKWNSSQPSPRKDFYSLLEIFAMCSLIPPLETNKIHHFYSYLCTNNGVGMEEFKEMMILLGLNEEIGLRNAEDLSRLERLLQGRDEGVVTDALQKFFKKLNIYEKVLNVIILPKAEYS